MKKVSKISDSEWEVMKVVWDHSPITSNKVVEILKPNTNWNPSTIYTLISRLVEKKAIEIQEGSFPYILRPLITRKECSRREYLSFIKKVYDGSLNLMISNAVEDHELSDTEIEELKNILDRSKDRG